MNGKRPNPALHRRATGYAVLEIEDANGKTHVFAKLRRERVLKIINHIGDLKPSRRHEFVRSDIGANYSVARRCIAAESRRDGDAMGRTIIQDALLLGRCHQKGCVVAERIKAHLRLQRRRLIHVP